MNVYFVDCENKSVDEIDKLGNSSQLYLFVNDNTKIHANIIGKAQNKGINVSFINKEKCSNKTNALDFLLDTWLGYIIAKDESKNIPNNSYYIVSEDTGYENVVKFWKKKGKQIKRIDNFILITKEQHTSSVTKDSKNTSEISKLSKEDKDLLDYVATAIKELQKNKLDALQSTQTRDLLVIYTELHRLVRKISTNKCSISKKRIKDEKFKRYIKEDKDKKFVLITKDFLMKYNLITK